MTDPIPAPQVLDPQRVSRDDRADMTTEDHRGQAQLLARALDESCAYAGQLWNDLSAARQYLFDCLPPERGGGPPEQAAAGGASPTGPDDEDGWQRWVDAFAAITSTLCGPHGDSGFGRTTALTVSRARRQVVVPVLDRDSGSAAASASGSAQAAGDHQANQNSSSNHDNPMGEGVDDAGGHPSTARTGHGLAASAPLLWGAVGSAVTFLAMRHRLHRPSG